MKPTLILVAVASLGLVLASPIAEHEPEPEPEPEPELEADYTTGTDTYNLAIGGGRFDISDLQSFSLFYANSSAYIGQIKYQSYSEPLIVSGAQNGIDTITFQSIHSSPTGWQQMYVVPRQSRPVGFSSPHGSAPQGTRTNEFRLGFNGQLQNHGLNLFYACRGFNDPLTAIHSYQIYWLAAGVPRGMVCKGPLNIHTANGCARNL